ncbi:MAG: DNA-directed RNA polymerase subunit alpha [Parcubacteria group bacterium CG08_land_8_20_14_0_20_43_9]|nr:MAG: DNA-directed RNA polymerase subunit alpha [Parcubacteria group bacterium CG08_land_8_20_14_0_20_43_9]
MILLPKAPIIAKKENNRAKFVVEGLYPGYGITLGNALRRVLLSSLEGAAVAQVKIKGAQHEFATLPGVLEDVITICLNLKKLRFKLYSDESQQATLKIQGEKVVLGKDLKLPSQLELVNKDSHIATLTDKKAVFEMEILVQKGIGYEPREIRDKEKLEIGQISLDAIYTPIQKVSYKVDNIRVGDRTDFERLSLEIETDGTISPEQALMEATEILIKHFNLIFEEKINFIKEKAAAKKTAGKSKAVKDREGDEARSFEDLKLSPRLINALANAHIKSIAGLARKKEGDILQIEGLEPKGLQEIKKAFRKSGIEMKK